MSRLIKQLEIDNDNGSMKIYINGEQIDLRDVIEIDIHLGLEERYVTINKTERRWFER